MRRKLFFSGLVVALPLTLAAVLILHPTRAKSDDTHASPAEVRVDNFSFGPRHAHSAREQHRDLGKQGRCPARDRQQ